MSAHGYIAKRSADYWRSFNMELAKTIADISLRHGFFKPLENPSYDRLFFMLEVMFLLDLVSSRSP